MIQGSEKDVNRPPGGSPLTVDEICDAFVWVSERGRNKNRLKSVGVSEVCSVYPGG